MSTFPCEIIEGRLDSGVSIDRERDLADFHHIQKRPRRNMDRTQTTSRPSGFCDKRAA